MYKVILKVDIDFITLLIGADMRRLLREYLAVGGSHRTAQGKRSASTPIFIRLT